MHINKIKEICLYIKDLNEAIHFYHNKLSFPIISKVEGSHVFFKAGSSVLLCFIPERSKQKASPPPHYAHGKQHIAFEVEAKLYERWKQKIKALGIQIIDEIKWPGDLFSFYFHDPEGHVLEIIPEGLWENKSFLDAIRN